MSAATCYKPNHETVCEDVCKAGNDKGFYEHGEEVFDYNFATGERKKVSTPSAAEDYPDTGGIITDAKKGEHLELCEMKRTQAIQENADIMGASAWMSAGELVVWLIVAGIMYGTYVLFEEKMKFKESFLCSDLSKSSPVNMEIIGKIYVLFCFIIMFVVRKLTQTKTLQKIDLLSIKEYVSDFLPYSVISLGGYVFFSGYLRMKASDTPMSGGGPMEAFKKMSTTALTVYVGIILMVINAFGLSYFYLKHKSKNRDDQYARTLYWGQITTLLIGGLTALCIALFTCSELISGGPFKTSYVLIKWILLILIVIGCIHLINIETSKPHRYLQTNEDLLGKENWFGNSTRAEEVYVGSPTDTTLNDAYKRDNGYSSATSSTQVADQKSSWKKNAFINVNGKCHTITNEDKCKANNATLGRNEGQCSWTNGRCLRADALPASGQTGDQTGATITADQCSDQQSAATCETPPCTWTPTTPAACRGALTSDASNCADVAAFVESGAEGDCPTGDGCSFEAASTEGTCSA